MREQAPAFAPRCAVATRSRFPERLDPPTRCELGPSALRGLLDRELSQFAAGGLATQRSSDLARPGLLTHCGRGPSAVRRPLDRELSQFAAGRLATKRWSDSARPGLLTRCGLGQSAVRYWGRSSSKAFTLLETIAVMAIIAILAAMLVPPIIKRVDRAAWTQETADLNNIADALTQSIIRSKTVPTYTNWSSAVADQMSVPVSAIATNARRYARAFLVDPTLSINGSGLPYTQGVDGSTKPNNARVMIVSSLAQTLPVTNSVPSSADFNAIWDAAENTVPAAPAFVDWAGTGDDLRIKKLNLEPLFHQLILFNHDPPGLPAPYSMDRGTTNSVPSGSSTNKYYLESSDLWLFDSAYNVRTRYLMRRSISFIFESGAWRGQIQGGETFTDTSGETASDFLKLATSFYNAPINPGAGAGASPSAVLVTLYTFMFDYVFWATECPNFSRHGDMSGTPSNVPEYNMLNDIGQSSSTGSIDKYAGSNGLLK